MAATRLPAALQTGINMPESRYPLRCCVLVMCAALYNSAQATEDPDLKALMLADQAPKTVEQPSNWRSFIEAGVGRSLLRSTGSDQNNQRLSVDLQYDNSFAPGWRVMLSDRLDMSWPPQSGDQRSINTIKEAYLSWQASSDQLLDAGRINVRNGVALGYNPTDFFRSSALRSVVSVDPASLKENRQGSIMLRGQQLWDSGSLTALFSPRISDQANNAAFNPDVGATNHENRWMLALSQKLSADITPQWLLFKSEQQPVQFGMNLTGLINDSTVLFAEWAGGRSTSLLTQAYQQQGIPAQNDNAFRNRAAVGVSYTTTNKLTLTGELEYNGGALDAQQWDRLRNGPLPLYGVYRNAVQLAQESPTKRSAFVYASWQDALINHLDLSAMTRYDMADASRMWWLEARYHLSHSEYALQWQRNSGNKLSDYGAAPKALSWQLLARYYF